MVRHFCLGLLLLVSQFVWGQDTSLKGEISFVTSNNVYVRFDDTEPIQIGDTFLIDGKACLVVNSKSTTSCVCSVIGGCEVKRGETVIYNVVPRDVEEVDEVVVETAPESKPLEEPELPYPQEIRARISLSSYSTLSNDRADRHRLMSTVSVTADHINDSKVSADVYLNYRQILDQGTDNALQNNSLLRVYNFAVGYEATPTLNVILGRAINPKISSVGAIDGIQLEKRLGASYVGLIGGSRPDIFDYGFNPELIQYGAYYGFDINSKDVTSQSTIGAIEQRGNGGIDRRFGYLQHSSTMFKNFGLFASAELDFYGKTDSVTVNNDLRLTNLYASARYRFSKAMNVMVSYDSRKRIIYYETYRTELDRILDDDLARQGIRGRVNFRPAKYVFVGLSYGKRFQSDQQNRSDNYYGYVSFSRTPFIDGTTSLSFNRNESNYLTSNVASLRHSRSFMRNRLGTDFYYRFVQYEYSNLSDPFLQHIAGVDLSYNINRTLLFSITGEFSMYNDSQNYRIYTRLVQRFHNKHKK